MIILRLFLILGNLAPASTVFLSSMQENQEQTITLYYSPRCPYSKKVLSYLSEKHLSIPLKDVTADKAAKEELQKVGGYLIVPCLIVDGVPIYNVNNIINWLAAHQEELSKRNSS